MPQRRHITMRRCAPSLKADGTGDGVKNSNMDISSNRLLRESNDCNHQWKRRAHSEDLSGRCSSICGIATRPVSLSRAEALDCSIVASALPSSCPRGTQLTWYHIGGDDKHQQSLQLSVHIDGHTPVGTLSQYYAQQETSERSILFKLSSISSP